MFKLKTTSSVKKLVIIVLLFFVECKYSNEEELLPRELEKEKSVEKIDQEYLSDIMDIIYSQKIGYLLSGNHNVQVVDEELSFVSSFGTKGHGPGEFIDPGNITAKGENIYVGDPGKSSLIQFGIDGSFIQEHKLFDRYFSINKFFIDDKNRFFFSSPKTRPVVVLEDLTKTTESLEFGEKLLYKDKNEEFTNNFYNLIYKPDNETIVISKTNPTIDFYNENGGLLFHYELPKSLFEDRLKFRDLEIKKDPSKISHTFNLVRDTYFDQGRLYILISENIGDAFDYFCNRVIEIETMESEPFIKAVYKLEGEVYSSICVNNGSLVGFNYSARTLELYRLPNPALTD